MIKKFLQKLKHTQWNRNKALVNKIKKDLLPHINANKLLSPQASDIYNNLEQIKEKQLYIETLLKHTIDITKMPSAKGAIRELQLFYVRLLKSFDEFCRRYNINYYIDSGTLLGAVRHKGFIPWDDDIDIVMLKEDFEKFKICLENEPKVCNSISNFSLIQYTGNPWKRSYRINKLVYPNLIPSDPKAIYYSHGALWIDIFVYNKTKIATSKVPLFKEKLFELGNQKDIPAFDNSSYDTFIKTVTHYNKHMDLLAQKYLLSPKWQNTDNPNDEVKEYVFEDIAFLNPHANCADDLICVKEESIFPLIELEFEGIFLKAPNNFNKILQIYYGSNYSDLPSSFEGHLAIKTIIRLCNIIQELYDKNIYTKIDTPVK